LEQINSSLHESTVNYNRRYIDLTNIEKEEYSKFPLSLRVQLPIAIKEHITINDFSSETERLRIKPWITKYFELYETLKSIDIDNLTTLISGEYSQIEKFKTFYRNDFNNLVEHGPSKPDLDFF